MFPQEALKIIPAVVRDHIENWNAFQVIRLRNVKQLQVGGIGVDVHAFMDISNGVARTVQQRIATQFRFVQNFLQFLAFSQLR